MEIQNLQALATLTTKDLEKVRFRSAISIRKVVDMCAKKSLILQRMTLDFYNSMPVKG